MNCIEDECMKKVLVVMATYNGEKYLSEQLESIFAQKNVVVEILVRDDSSTDDTQRILDEYEKKGKLQWYTGEHLNVAKGYYDLLKTASKIDVDYIAFADQDDVWDVDKLFVAIQHLDTVAMNIPALYYCGQRLVDGNLNFIANHELNGERSLLTRFVLSDFAGCTGVFNKALLQAVVEYEPNYMLMHDTWILKVCLCLGGEAFIDVKPHMSYRQHGGNTVGLGRSLPAYFKQVNQYLNEYHVEMQMKELLDGYGDKMIIQYKSLAKQICNYKKSFQIKKHLLDKKYINFYNMGLNLTFDLKVLLNKL